MHITYRTGFRCGYQCDLVHITLLSLKPMLQAFTHCNFVFVLLSECFTLAVAGRGRQSTLPSSYWDVVSG